MYSCDNELQCPRCPCWQPLELIRKADDIRKLHMKQPNSISLSLSQTSQYFWYMNLWYGKLRDQGLELSFEEKENILHWTHADLSPFTSRATIFPRNRPGRWECEAYCNLQKLYNGADISKYATRCPIGCGKISDKKGDHAFSCLKLAHRTHRHHNARRNLTAFVEATGEKPVFSQDDKG